MFRPQSLVNTVFLAKQEEAKTLKTTLTYSKSEHKPNNTSSIEQRSHNKFSYDNSYQKAPMKDKMRTKSTLTSKEINERREKGLCFHCDDAYHPGKECKARLYAIIGEEETVKEEDMTNIMKEMETVLHTEDIPGEISLNAMVGHQTPNTVRLQGIKKQKIGILVDSGSTHSFIDTESVKKLKLVAEVIPPLVVIMVDGNKVLVNTSCKSLQYLIQGHTFNIDVRVFLLGGYDMVLGVNWLRQHNPVTCDFEKINITIHSNGQEVILQGTPTMGKLQTISCKRLSKLLKGKESVSQGYLCLISAESEESKVVAQPVVSAIQTLLEEYKDTFAEPVGLPPQRNHDHNIPLVQGSQPVNQRGYRVP